MRAIFIVVPAVVAGAWLCADTVLAAVSSTFRSEPSTPPIERKVKRAPPPVDPVRFAGFGDGREEVEEGATCPAGVQVLSAVTAGDWPDAAVAAVRLKGDLAAVQRGDVLADAPVERVRVDENGIAEVLLRVDGSLVACRAISRTVPRSDAGGGTAEADGVRCDGATCTISRTLVEAIATGERTDAWRGVRIVPYFDGGTAAGFKLYGITAPTEVAKLGLKNGDVVKSVNGIALQDPGDVFRAYAALRHASTFDISLLREGRDHSLRVEVR